MKQKLPHLFSILMTIILAIPVTNGQSKKISNYKFNTPIEVWTSNYDKSKINNTHITTEPGYYRQAAASDNMLFSVVGGTKDHILESVSGKYITYGYYIGKDKQSYWSGGTSSTAMPYKTSGTYYYLGPAIASDDAGTLWCTSVRSGEAPSASPWAIGAKAFTYYTVRPGGDKDPVRSGIALGDYATSGRADLMSVSGDGVNGKAFFWFAIAGTNKIECIVMEKKVPKKILTFTAPVTFANNYASGYVKEFADYSRLLLNVGSSGNNTTELYLGSIHGGEEGLYNGTATVTWDNPGATGLKVARYGSTAFLLQGHGIIAYSSSKTEVKLYDWTAQMEIGTIKPFGDNTSGSTYVSHSMDVKIINENTAELYIYSPGVGGAKYSITASVIDNPVTNINATHITGTANTTVTWELPSLGTPAKYAVSYSTDGGSSWSTAVETTEMAYTYHGLTTGSYIFKVAPYYEDTQVWGGEAISQSISVIDAQGASITNLQYSYEVNEKDNVGRQDIILTWETPTGMVNTSVTGYKVYRGETLLATLGADVLTYTHEGVKENYTYKVVPLFDGIGENSSYGLTITPTEVTITFVAPYFSEVRNYAGYSLTELFYKMPAYAPYKPLYYNLYRDGMLIQGKLQAYNTLDESLVRSSKTTTVNYQIEAVYGSAADTYPAIDSVKSNLYPVTIAPRDWAKTGFILQEVYNVPIDEIAADKKPNLFDNNDYYRQGQFFDGKWYIAQRADNLSKKDDPNYTADDKLTEILSGVEGTKGGVVTFNATSKSDIEAGVVERIITSENFASVGLAIDDAGNIFMRHNNDSNVDMATTAPAIDAITGQPVAWLTYVADGFTRRITRGAIYKRNADGTYSTTPSVINLNPLWTDNDWINTMVCTYQSADYGDKNGQVTGRSDYYNMYGDVMSAEGGYLILSPSWTRTAFKVKIANGAYVSHEVIEFNRYENTGYLLEPKTGAENYGFHLDGRDAVTVQIRSNGYYGVHEWNQEGTSGWHPIFTADSRVNNAGGTSIQAFGKKITQEDVEKEGSIYKQEDIGRHTGELFIITPQSMHSHNVGDFLISRATKTNTTDFADQGSLMPSTPVAMKVQTDARSNSTATNANGNWFHAEVGTYASAMKDDDECVDIYQYVPGTRFARYRLIQSNQFPQVQPTLDITTAYNDDRTEITHFDGLATWNRPVGFGRSTGSANAKVKSYIVELYNSKNELVATDEVDEIYDEDGNPVEDTYEYKFDYKAKTDKDDIDFGRYSVSVSVKYETLNGSVYVSDPLFAEDIHDYTALPAENLAVYVFKNNDKTVSEWVQDENGEWVVGNKVVDAYRVELDFNKPDYSEEAEGEQPVSYYTIRAGRTMNNEVVDTIEITNFDLHLGKVDENGVTRAKYETVSQIPGTYDFNNNKAPFYHKEGDAYGTAGQSRVDGVLTWHHTVDNGTYNENGMANARTAIYDEPDKWHYIVVAHYAAENKYIKKAEPTYITNPDGMIPTGVEVIGEDEASSLHIYPIPASTEITINSPEAVNSIVVYNEAGVEVMSLAGNGETTTTVNIEDLTTGYYFVKVNNQAPVKIIKK